jgi:hypothetical protein
MNALNPNLIRMIAIRSALLLLLATPATIHAQSTSNPAAARAAQVARAAQHGAIHAGDEVRVRWSFGSQYGYGLNTASVVTAEVVEYTQWNIQLRRGSRVFTLPMSSVQALERRIGTKPASAPAMVKGSAIGFLAGFAAGVLTAKSNGAVPSDEVVDSGVVGGVLLGAPVGAFIAYLTSRRRGIYEKVPFNRMNADFAVAPSGRMGLSLALPTG